MAEQITRRPFIREVPKTRWFFQHPRYLRYMAREVTCIFIAIYTTILVVGIVRLAQSREAYDAYLAALASTISILFHLLALAFALYHSFTWFNLAPKALPIHLGDKTVSPAAIAVAHYVAWVVISLIVLVVAGAL